jgi:hypothetical protein
MTTNFYKSDRTIIGSTNACGTLGPIMQYIEPYHIPNVVYVSLSDNVITLGDYCFANCTDLTSIQFNDSQNIDLVGSQCFTGIGSSPVVKYYNAKDFDELPNSLKNAQKKFKSATFIYYACPYV